MKRGWLRTAIVAALVLGAQAFGSAAERRRIELLPATTISTATTITGAAVGVRDGLLYLSVQSTFTYGSGGTATKVYVQTSLDNGATWRDVACQTFTTAAAKKFSAVNGITALAASQAVSDGALADDTILSGLLGDLYRVKVVTTGTYAGATSIAVSAVIQ